MNWFKRSDIYDDIKKYGPQKVRGDDPWINTDTSLTKEYLDKHNIKNVNLNDPYGSSFYNRAAFIDRYSWSIPTKEAVEEIKNFVGGDQVLEIGAGNGLWAKLLNDIGVKVTATNRLPNDQDIHNYYIKPDYSQEKYYHPIEYMDHYKAIKHYGNYPVLMMSWPPYNDPMAYESLKKFKGNKLIFIGEDYGGCTGCGNFFELLNSQWTLVKEVEIPQWMGLHDALFLYSRK